MSDTSNPEAAKDGKNYSSMNASQKTAYLGFKIFSERELNDRQKKAVARRTAGARKFLEDVLANPDLELGKHMDDNALGRVFQEPINGFYDYAVKEGLSMGDLDAIMDDIIQIAYMFKRTSNEASSEVMRLAYALTGENQMSDVPLKDVKNLTTLMRETRPVPVDPEYADEPSLSQTEEIVEDAPVAEEDEPTLDEVLGEAQAKQRGEEPAA